MELLKYKEEVYFPIELSEDILLLIKIKPIEEIAEELEEALKEMGEDIDKVVEEAVKWARKK